MGRNIRNFYLYPNCREIDWNGLVGLIGGYIGLFLGYSLLQIPDLILLLSENAKKYFRKWAAHVANDSSQSTEIQVKEVLSNHIGLKTTTRSSDCCCKYAPWLLQSELKQLSQNMVEISEEIRGEIKVNKGKIEILERQLDSTLQNMVCHFSELKNAIPNLQGPVYE